MAPMLSHHNVGDGMTIRISRRSELIQINSEVELAIALYSASVLDLATVGYFLEFQEIKLFPR